MTGPPLGPVDRPAVPIGYAPAPRHPKAVELGPDSVGLLVTHEGLAAAGIHRDWTRRGSRDRRRPPLADVADGMLVCCSLPEPYGLCAGWLEWPAADGALHLREGKSGDRLPIAPRAVMGPVLLYKPPGGPPRRREPDPAA